jgi:hypothetical protein
MDYDFLLGQISSAFVIFHFLVLGCGLWVLGFAFLGFGIWDLGFGISLFGFRFYHLKSVPALLTGSRTA